MIGWKDAQSTEFNKDTTHPMVHTHTHTITTFMISHLPPLLYAGDRDARAQPRPDGSYHETGQEKNNLHRRLLHHQYAQRENFPKLKKKPAFFPVFFSEKLYGNEDYVEERHRHRYEVNPEYIDILEGKGLKFVGRSTDHKRMEILELEGTISQFAVFTHTILLAHSDTHTQFLILTFNMMADIYTRATALVLTHTVAHSPSLSHACTHTQTTPTLWQYSSTQST